MNHRWVPLACDAPARADGYLFLCAHCLSVTRDIPDFTKPGACTARLVDSTGGVRPGAADNARSVP